MAKTKSAPSLYEPGVYLLTQDSMTVGLVEVDAAATACFTLVRNVTGLPPGYASYRRPTRGFDATTTMRWSPGARLETVPLDVIEVSFSAGADDAWTRDAATLPPKRLFDAGAYDVLRDGTKIADLVVEARRPALGVREHWFLHREAADSLPIGEVRLRASLRYRHRGLYVPIEIGAFRRALPQHRYVIGDETPSV
jgi:hypothetical protein